MSEMTCVGPRIPVPVQRERSKLRPKNADPETQKNADPETQKNTDPEAEPELRTGAAVGPVPNQLPPADEDALPAPAKKPSERQSCLGETVASRVQAPPVIKRRMAEPVARVLRPRVD